MLYEIISAGGGGRVVFVHATPKKESKNPIHQGDVAICPLQRSSLDLDFREDTVVGRVPSQWQLDAAAELQKLFAEKVATAGGDVSDADTEMQSVAEDAW